MVKEKLNFCLVIFPLISLKKDKVSSLNEKGVLGPESSDMEIKDAFEVSVSVPCQVGFEYRSRI